MRTMLPKPVSRGRRAHRRSRSIQVIEWSSSSETAPYHQGIRKGGISHNIEKWQSWHVIRDLDSREMVPRRKVQDLQLNGFEWICLSLNNGQTLEIWA